MFYKGQLTELWRFLIGPSVSSATFTTSEHGEMKMIDTSLTLLILYFHLRPVTKAFEGSFGPVSKAFEGSFGERTVGEG